MLCLKQNDKTKKDFSLHSQYLAFVDDLVFIDKKHDIQMHYQLKNSKSICWGSSFKSIQDDFIKQQQINTKLKIKHTQLFLVLSDEDKTNDSNSRPSNIFLI